MKLFLRRLFCSHLWSETLVFGGNPNTHKDIKYCIKCGKTIIVFQGTGKQWREHHNYKETK